MCPRFADCGIPSLNLCLRELLVPYSSISAISALTYAIATNAFNESGLHSKYKRKHKIKLLKSFGAAKPLP